MRTAAVGSFISIRIMHDAERSDMRITGVSAYPIAIPYRVPWRNRHTEDSGRPMTHLETTIMEVHTDEGISGLGEAKGLDVAGQIRQRFGPALMGRDPLQIASAVTELECRFGRSQIVAGIDFALHDIAGKALDVPVYQLLGGKTRESVPLVWTLPYLDIESQVDLAMDRVAEGFTNAIKMKVGIPGDYEHVLAVGMAIGSVPIRPDSNMGHSKQQALRQTSDLQSEGVKIELLEDPCPTDWDDYQDLADQLDVEISVHGGWNSLDDLAGLIRAAKPGIRCVNVMPTDWGIYRSAQIVGALEVAGIGWTMGTSHDSSIKIAASLHLGTSLPNAIYPCDLLGPRLHVADVATAPLSIHAGQGTAPETAGLGVELDRDVLENYHVDSFDSPGTKV